MSETDICFIFGDLHTAIARKLWEPSFEVKSIFNMDMRLKRPIGIRDDVIEIMFPELMKYDKKTYIESAKFSGKHVDIILCGPYTGYNLIGWATFPEAKTNLSRFQKWWRKRNGVPEEFKGNSHFYFKLEKSA